MPDLIVGSRAGGARLVADPYRAVDTEEALAAAGPDTPVLLPRALFETAWPRLSNRSRLGVRLSPQDDVAALAPYLARLDLVALDFPQFTDGRGYSQARLLRERFGFTGELRAVGDILRDQVFYLVRAGFDALVLRADQDPVAALVAFGDFRDAYQASVDQPLPLFRRRTEALARLRSRA